MLNHACSSVWHACRLDLPTSQLACQNCSTGFARQIKAGDEAGFVVSGSSVIWTLSGEWAWICYGKPTSVNKRYVVIDVCWVWLNAVFTILLLVHTYVILVLVQSRKWTMEVLVSDGAMSWFHVISALHRGQAKSSWGTFAPCALSHGRANSIVALSHVLFCLEFSCNPEAHM